MLSFAHSVTAVCFTVTLGVGQASSSKGMVVSTFAHWTTRSLYQFVSHRSEWVKDLTNQVSLTSDSRSLFRPLGYQVIMHRVLHTLSGSKVWCLTNQVLLTSNYGRSVFRPLGYLVTCTVFFTLGVGQTQRSDELSCQGELKTVSVSVTRSCPTVSITNTWIVFRLLYTDTLILSLYSYIIWAIFPCSR